MLKIFLKNIFITIINIKALFIKKIYFYRRIDYIIKLLNKNQINKVSKFREQNWHHGYCYFLGIYNSKKVFIKVDTKLMLLRNEKYFYDAMKNKLKSFLIPLIMFHEDEKVQFVVFEYFNDCVDLTLGHLSDNVKFIDDIYFILLQLKEAQIVHRDIKLSNFLIKKNELFLIDFTFSVSLSDSSPFKDLNTSIKSHHKILESLGLKISTNNFSWNDSLSIIKILGKLSNHSGKEHSFDVQRFRDLSINTTYSINENAKN